MSDKLFSVRCIHTGGDPLGDHIPEDHAFFVGGLTCHEKGKDYHDLDVGEGGCVRRGTTADSKYVENHKTYPICYNVTRVQ